MRPRLFEGVGMLLRKQTGGPLSFCKFPISSYAAQHSSSISNRGLELRPCYLLGSSPLISQGPIPALRCSALTDLKFIRCYSSAQEKPEKSTSVSDRKESSDGSVLEKVLFSEKEPPKTKTAKVAAASRDTFYLFAIIAGVGVTGALLYGVFGELFSSKSASRVYSRALKLVSNNDEVRDLIGSPISGYGGEGRRNQRRLVQPTMWKHLGLLHMRLQFHITGPEGKGLVSLEMAETEEGGWDYRYLYVETDDFPPKVVVLIDKR